MAACKAAMVVTMKRRHDAWQGGFRPDVAHDLTVDFGKVHTLPSLKGGQLQYPARCVTCGGTGQLRSMRIVQCKLAGGKLGDRPSIKKAWKACLTDVGTGLKTASLARYKKLRKCEFRRSPNAGRRIGEASRPGP